MPEFVLSHITVGTDDIERATAFYDAVLGELGTPRKRRGESFAGWGTEGEAAFYVTRPFDRQAMGVGNGTSVLFLAPSRDAVDRFWRKATALGAKDEGPPGLRPHYHANYYGAYLRDLDGNKIGAVCHKPEGRG
jgi:catechol 2,3-dioxygenase-like lactoylglutathione lyase family enzyme